MRYSFFLLTVLLFLTIIMPIRGQEKDTYVIIYDEGHEQFFTSDLMKTALGSLADALGTDVVIRGNYQAFNATSLQGADLVIISNPGITSSGSMINIGSEEKQHLDDFVVAGGNVMYMSNPFSLNRSLAGHAKPMNDLLITELANEYEIFKIAGDTENVTTLVDDLHSDGNFTHLYADVSNFDNDVFFTEPNNLSESKVLVSSTWVKSSISAKNYANISTSTYALDQDFRVQIDGVDKDPNWMGAIEYGDGRAMVLGSTIMFSDVAYDESSTWINQESNLRLFQNLVAWSLQLTPIPRERDIIGESFAFFATYNMLVGLGLALLFITIWFFALIYRGSISFRKIFSFIKPNFDKPSSKKKKRSQKSESVTKKTKKKTKKKRRKRT